MTHQIDGAYHYTQVRCPSLEAGLAEFKALLINLEAKGNPRTFVHFGDGDYFFLSQIPNGSARPGKRALSKAYSALDMVPFQNGFLKNDYVGVEKLEEENLRRFKAIFPIYTPDFPTEFLYILVANRWLFSQFRGRIGLIGASEKLDLIERLMSHKEYQEYLGIEKFNDYVRIPQKFACDDLGATVKSVSDQLRKTSSTVFLFGVGHVKGGLIHTLREAKDAIYLDVGGGIDAIAGIVDPNRPFMNNWKNHRLSRFDYSKIDFLQYSHTGNEILIDEKD
jgi:hypothetical protein